MNFVLLNPTFHINLRTKFITYIHGSEVSHCACVVTGVLFSDVNKVFYHVGCTCEPPFK